MLNLATVQMVMHWVLQWTSLSNCMCVWKNNDLLQNPITFHHKPVQSEHRVYDTSEEDAVAESYSWRPLRAHAGKRIAMDMILRQIQVNATQDRTMTYQDTQMHTPLSNESQLWKYTTAVITGICTKNRFPIRRPGLPVWPLRIRRARRLPHAE